MIFRRPLSALLGEVAQGALDGAADTPVRITDIEVDLPIELRLSHRESGAELLGDVPLFLTRTLFDPPVSRLAVRWVAEGVER